MSDDLSGFSLMELFRGEAEEQLNVLSEGLLALERSDAGAVPIEPLMRAAHSLKGAARIVGLTSAEQIAHALEDAFVAAQHGRVTLKPHHIDTMLGAIDLMGELSRLDESLMATWGDTHGDRLVAMVQSLQAVAEDRLPEAPAAAEGSGPEAVAGETPGASDEEFKESSPPGEAATVGDVEGKAPGGASHEESAEPGLAPEGATLLDFAAEAPTERDAPAGESAGPPQVGESRESAGDAPVPVELEPPPATPDRSQAPKASAAAAEGGDRVVRVAAESLNRLMGLAGASLVEARQLRPLVDAMIQLKTMQTTLWGELQALEDALATRESSASGGASPDHERELLARAKGHATRCLEDLGTRIERLEVHARRGEDLAERLHREVIASRLRPLIDGIRGFPRMVRDVARQLGKQVRFETVGEQTGVDRDILEKLEAPLNHLIRNALDHGVETPEERRAAGKDPTAVIRLEAYHAAGMLQLTLTDDGRGVDTEKLRRRVVERGMVAPGMAEQLTEAELLEFLFLSGFTTKSDVTDLSGRGVGLDVVQSMAQAVGGAVRIATRLGQGTTFRLNLPITMSVIRALIVDVGAEPYAFPLTRLDRIAIADRSKVEVIEGRHFVKIDDQSIGLVWAAQILDVAPGGTSSEDLLPVVVVSDRSHCFGVVVDGFLGERDLDVRPLDTRLGKVPNLNSASLLEDGRPVLIVDVEDLVRSIDNLLGGRRLRPMSASADASAGPRRAKRILVVDDSITVRELERQLLESRGFVVDVAVDGMDGWNTLRSGQYDLVVSDVDMPRLDGIGFVKNLRQDPRFASLPVVIVSYKDREEDRLRGLEAGANSYLTKSSFHDETFLDTVVDLIGEAAGP